MQKCQLTQNITASQIAPDGLSETDRTDVETMTSKVKGGKTNWFQLDKSELSSGQDFQTKQIGERKVELTWNSAYAHNDPIDRYEVWRNETKIGELPHQPQISTVPFRLIDDVQETGIQNYDLVTIDMGGNAAKTVIKFAE